MKSGRQQIKQLKKRVAELEQLVESYKLLFAKTSPGDYSHAPVYVDPPAFGPIPQKPCEIIY